MCIYVQIYTTMYVYVCDMIALQYQWHMVRCGRHYVVVCLWAVCYAVAWRPRVQTSRHARSNLNSQIRGLKCCNEQNE